MNAAKPAFVGDYGLTYEGIVQSWAYEVLAFETFGSYQGDHLALVTDAGRFGLIVFGYGSCSGCDQLQAIEPSHWYDDDEEQDWSKVIEFSDELREGIHWEPSREALAEWVDAHPENHWWSYEDEIARWLDQNLGTHLSQEPTP